MRIFGSPSSRFFWGSQQQFSATYFPICYCYIWNTCNRVSVKYTVLFMHNYIGLALAHTHTHTHKTNTQSSFRNVNTCNIVLFSAYAIYLGAFVLVLHLWQSLLVSSLLSFLSMQINMRWPKIHTHFYLSEITTIYCLGKSCQCVSVLFVYMRALYKACLSEAFHHLLTFVSRSRSWAAFCYFLDICIRFCAHRYCFHSLIILLFLTRYVQHTYTNYMHK